MEKMAPSVGRQLKGPRPPPLTVNKSSSKIKKSHGKKLSPVIIYLKSPDVIHVRPEEFMSLVQRLTGKQEGNDRKNLASSSSSSSAAAICSAMVDSNTMENNGASSLRLAQRSVDVELDDEYRNNFCLDFGNDWSEFQ